MSSRAEPGRSAAPLWAWAAVLAAGLGLWLVMTAAGDGARAWRAFLVSFLFFTPLAGGLVVWRAIVVASRGGWAGEAEGLADAARGFALPSLVALAVLWLGAQWWAPWRHLDPHQGLWLDTGFVLGRNLVALVVFWGVAAWSRSRVESRQRGAAAALIVAYCLVFSLLGFDLVMALDPEWASSLFGGYFFVSGLYAAVAAWTAAAAATGRARGDRLHDLGRLLLAFSILTTYLMFAQLLIMYYENLPRETRFLVPRLNGGPWTLVSALLLAVVYLGPLLLLLTVRAKRSPAWVGSVAVVILVAMWVERWWLVAPTLGGAAVLGLPELGAAAAFAGALGLAMTLALGRRRAAVGSG